MLEGLIIIDIDREKRRYRVLTGSNPVVRTHELFLDSCLVVTLHRRAYKVTGTPFTRLGERDKCHDGGGEAGNRFAVEGRETINETGNRFAVEGRNNK